MLIEIVKWEKHNPRTNAKQWSWLRLQNDIFDDEDLDDFEGWQFVVWIYTLTRRNKANTVAFNLNVRHCAKKATRDQVDVVATLKLLEQRGKIKILEADPAALPSSSRTSTHVDVPLRTQTFVDPPTRTHEHPTLRDVTLRHDTDGRREDSTLKRTAKRRRPPPVPTDADLAVGSLWLAYATEVMPWKTRDPTWAPIQFAAHLVKVAVKAELTHADLEAVLTFVKGDKFWRKNAVSPAGLLKRSDNGLLKIDNILAAMQPSRQKSDADAETIKAWAEGRASGI